MRFDDGLQPERTALSWHRTALSVVVGGAVALKALPDLMGVWGAVSALVVIAAGASLGLIAQRRSERATRALIDGRALLPDGRLLAAVSGLVAAVAVVAIAVVVRLART